MKLSRRNLLAAALPAFLAGTTPRPSWSENFTPAFQRRQLASSIEAAGGTVGYSAISDGLPTGWRHRLGKFIGHEYFGPIRSVTFETAGASLADLSFVEQCPELDFLCVCESQLTDLSLRSLRACPDLKYLYLNSDKLTDACVDEIQRLAKLATLELHSRSLTDAVAGPIGQLQTLTHLSLNYSQLTDAGVAKLAQLKQMWQLSLAHTQISDASLTTIGELRELRFLDLRRTSVGDAGLTSLASLRELFCVLLCDTEVTDHGLGILAERLPWLRSVFLTETQITEQGLLRLQGLENLMLLRVDEQLAVSPAIQTLRDKFPGLSVNPPSF